MKELHLLDPVVASVLSDSDKSSERLWRAGGLSC